ncbi:MAG: phosphatidate cytidylyltransferase [Nitrospirota bacterium]
MHRRRLITAAIALPIAFAYVMWLPPVFFTAVLCLASGLGLSEFYGMYGVRGALRNLGLALGVAIPAGVHLAGISDLVVASLLVLGAARLFLKKDPSGALKDLSPVFVGLLYVPALLGAQTGIRAAGPEWIIFLFGVVWGSDSAAYYVGKGLGKHKLYEAYSPNKTVEGAAASIAGGALSALALGALLISSVPAGRAAIMGATIGAVTIVGDLVESMFKRDAGVKDSGTLIPGHGGILDKIDGVLFAGPVLYWMLRLFGAP